MTHRSYVHLWFHQQTGSQVKRLCKQLRRGEDLPSPIFLDVSLATRTRLRGSADRLLAGPVLFCTAPLIPGASRNHCGRIIFGACRAAVPGNLVLEARQMAAEVALDNGLVESTFVDLATSTSRRALRAGQRRGRRKSIPSELESGVAHQMHTHMNSSFSWTH